MNITAEIDFDPDELGKLRMFLQNASGRICGAVVPGMTGAQALVERLKGLLPPLEITIAEKEMGAEKLGQLARTLGGRDCVLILLMKSGTNTSEDEAFWEQLNFQRESLAWGNIRTCLILDPQGESNLHRWADDLLQWIILFHFPEAIPQRQTEERTISDFVASGKEIEEIEGIGLDVLKPQYEKARELRTEKPELLYETASEYFIQLVNKGYLAEAVRIWDADLAGAGLEQISSPKIYRLLRSRIELARMQDDSEGREVWSRYYLQQAQKGKIVKEIAWALSEAGESLFGRGRFEDGQKAFEEAVLILGKAIAEGRRELRHDLANVYSNRGLAYGDLGRLDEAVSDYGEALKIRKELVEREGRWELRNAMAKVYNNRGLAYGDLGQLDQAVSDYGEALKLRKELVETEGRRELRNDLAKVYNNRGNAYGALGRLDEALADYGETLKLYRELVEGEGRRELRHNLAGVYGNRGIVYRALGRLDEALADYGEALKLYRELEEGEGRRELRNALANLYSNRGNAYRALGRLDEALADCSEALKLSKELVETEGRQELRHDLAKVYNNRGSAYMTLRRLDEALADYGEALKLYRELVDGEGRRELRNALANVYSNCGLAYGALGRLDEAVSDYGEALKLSKELVEREDRRGLRNDLARILWNRAYVYCQKEAWDKAREDYLYAVKLVSEMIKEGFTHVLFLFARILGWGCHLMGQMDVVKETAEGVRLVMGAIGRVYRQLQKGTEQCGDVVGFLEAVVRYQKELNKAGAQVDAKRVEEMLAFLKER